MSSWNGRWMHWRGLALANPWPFLASFALGAVLAFVYSYVPLHTVNNRKVERLEASVLTKEVRIDDLARELGDLREGTSDAPDESQLAALETERDEALRSSELSEKESAKAKRRVRKLEGERAEWKRKIASLEAAAKKAASLAVAPPAETAASAAPSVAAETVAPAVEPSQAASPSRAVAGAAPPGAAPSDEAIPAAPAP